MSGYYPDGVTQASFDRHFNEMDGEPAHCPDCGQPEDRPCLKGCANNDPTPPLEELVFEDVECPF